MCIAHGWCKLYSHCTSSHPSPPSAVGGNALTFGAEGGVRSVQTTPQVRGRGSCHPLPSRWPCCRPQVLPGGGLVSFLHRLGSGSGSHCENVDAGEGVSLMAIWADGAGEVAVSLGVVWSSNADLAYYKAQARNVSLWLTAPAGGHWVVLRWEQLKHSGAGYDWWMLDDIQIDIQGEWQY